MFLAIDIGNTSVSCAVLKNGRVIQTYFADSTLAKKKLAFEVSVLFKKIKRRYPAIQTIGLCSVVPKALDVIRRASKAQWGIEPHVIGKDIKVPIKNKYRNPRQVGQDRLVGAYAATRLYKAPVIIIDFGTATTFDVVSHKGEYEGGMIVPGIQLSADSLFKKTALLPRVTIRSPRTLIGKNTQESILSGIFFGYGAMCLGLIDQIVARVKGKPKVIVTGGHTHLMKRFIAKKITKIDNDLVFKGMYWLLEDKLRS